MLIYRREIFWKVSKSDGEECCCPSELTQSGVQVSVPIWDNINT